MEKIKFYFAPMEGITGYTFRNVHHRCYPGMDRYFTPFISPNQHHAVNPKEHRDVTKEHNEAIPLIPQILTNKPELFLATAKELKETYGYQEVNLNLGCPSKTVVSKGKGSGFLADPYKLESFLENVYSVVGSGVSTTETGEELSKYPGISIKTRLGIEDVSEFSEILHIYNKYPISELIIHPRVQKEFYKGTPHLEAFAEAVKESPHSLCYNGDIFCLEDYLRIKEYFPTVKKMMLGRGLLMNPGLVLEIQSYEKCMTEGKEWKGYQTSFEKLKEYHAFLLQGYLEQMNGDATNVLFKMKELWGFLGQQFPNERLVKKMIKANHLKEYMDLAARFFEREAE